MLKLTEEHLSQIGRKVKEYAHSNPKAYLYNIAQFLEVTELEVLASGEMGEATLLHPLSWKDFLQDLKSLGKVMALTRNDSVVHEKKGVYDNVRGNPHSIALVNPDIDLRIFPKVWQYAYAVSQQDGAKKSIQIFDRQGVATHKIFLLPESQSEEFENFIEKHKLSSNDNGSDNVPIIEALEEKGNSENIEVDVAAYHQAWRGLKDTHDFYPLLQKLKISRLQALELAEEEFVTPVQENTLQELLKRSVEMQIPIMCFVGNSGTIQIHTGPIQNVKEVNEWYNVLDPSFNLHVNIKNISSAWVVRKPTKDGIVRSVEIFDKNKELIVQFFGKRKPGSSELEPWKDLLEELAEKNTTSSVSKQSATS